MRIVDPGGTVKSPIHPMPSQDTIAGSCSNGIAPIKHHLSTLSATFLVVASMLGTGILTTTGIILSLLKTPEAVVLVWVMGGILACFGAYCYGVIVKVLPRNGGEAIILREFFSPVLGEIAGWTSFVVGFAASNAATSLALSAYLDAALPQFAQPPALVACCALVLVTALHSVVGPSGIRIQTLLAIIKFSLFAGLGFYGLMLASPPTPVDVGSASRMASFGPEWGVAMMLVMFAYSGWNAAIYVAEEAANPGRTVRNAMIIGSIITLLLYVTLNLALLNSLPAHEIDGVIPVMAILVKSLFGIQASAWFSGIVAFALLSSLGASAFIGPRVLATVLSWMSPQRNPSSSPPAQVSPQLYWLQAGLSILMVITGTFEQILTIMGFLLGVFPVLCVLGMYRIREKTPAVARYLFAPLFVGVMSVILILGAVQRPAEVSIALLLVFAFSLLRFGKYRFA